MPCRRHRAISYRAISTARPPPISSHLAWQQLGPDFRARKWRFVADTHAVLWRSRAAKVAIGALRIGADAACNSRRVDGVREFPFPPEQEHGQRDLVDVDPDRVVVTPVVAVVATSPQAAHLHVVLGVKGAGALSYGRKPSRWLRGSK